MSTAKLIDALALKQAKADADRTSGSLPFVPPTTVEILDPGQAAAGGNSTAWFVFDFVVLHSAQSGSDWYVHYVYAGSATVRGEQLVDSKLTCLREANVTEHQMEWAAERYDHDRVRKADRDAWWAKAR